MISTKSLTPKQICDIIRLCNKNRVSRLKLGDLEIDFYNGSQPDGNQSVYASQVSYPAETEELKPATTSKMKTQEVHLTPEQKEILEEARLSQLQTEDPLAYEQEMIDLAMSDSSRQVPEGENESEDY